MARILLLLILFFLQGKIRFCFLYFTKLNFYQISTLFLELWNFFMSFYMKYQLVQVFKPISEQFAVGISILFKSYIEHCLFRIRLCKLIVLKRLSTHYVFLLFFKYFFHIENELIFLLNDFLVKYKQFGNKYLARRIRLNLIADYSKFG